MLSKFLILIWVITNFAFAEEWISIRPLPDCSKFRIEYSEYNGLYKVRFKESPYSDKYTYAKENLDDLNNLSILTDIIVQSAENYCPSSMDPFTILKEQNPCPEIQTNNITFTDSFVSFIRDIFQIVDRKNNCEDIIPYIELQNKIANLSDENLLHFKSHFHIFKLFTGNNTDNLINQYKECGGSNGSDKFVQNIILLEAKKACLFPSPPGQISFEESKKIAKEIAKQYAGNSLLDLNSKQNEITYKTADLFLQNILNTQLKSLLGSSIDTKEKMEQLTSYKNFKNIKPQKTLSYLENILSVDAPLEIIDNSLDEMIEHNFTEILGNDFNEEEKKDFLNKQFSPRIKKNYQACIAPYKKRIHFSEKDISKKQTHRNSLKESFCKANNQACYSENSCQNTINFLTDNSKIKDLNVIQSCIFDGINKNMNLVLEKIVGNAIDKIGSNIRYTETYKLDLINKSNEILMSCANDKFKEIGPDKQFVTKSETNISLNNLQNITTEQYAQTLKECSVKVEEYIVRDVGVIHIASMNLFKKNDIHKNNHKIDIKGISLDQFQYNKAKDSLNASLDRCLHAQRSKSQITTAQSSQLCLPMIELNIAREVISNGLEESLSIVPRAQKERILTHFDQCAELAINDSYNSIFNKDHKNPIYDDKSMKSFLENNHDYLNCTKAAINSTTEVITLITLDTLEKDLTEKLSKPSFYRDIKQSLLEKSKACISNGLNRIKTWNEFSSFNSSGNFDILKNQCESEITEYALPILITKEIDFQIKNLNGTKLTDIDLKNITSEIALKYNIKTPYFSFLEKDKNIIVQAYRKFKEKKPNGDMDLFIKDITTIAQNSVITNLHSRLMNRVVEKGLPNYDFSAFRTKLPKGCLSSIYESQKENIEALVKDINDATKDDDKNIEKDLMSDFVDFITLGLKRAHTLNQYDRYIDTLNRICQSPKKYKDINKLVATGVGDHIILAQVELKIKNAFYNVAKDQCLNDIKLLNIKMENSFYDDYCEIKTHSEMEKKRFVESISKQNILSIEQKNLLQFITARHQATLGQIENKLDTQALNNMFIKSDNSILKLIYSHFNSVLINESRVMDQITHEAVETLFRDQSRGSFADDFIKSQLTSGIGLQGYKIAKEKVNESVSKSMFDFDKVKKSATKSLDLYWNQENLDKYINWENIDNSQRSKLISSVYENVIMLEINPKTTESERMTRSNNLTNIITEHITNYPSAPNRKYKPRRKMPFFTKTGSVYFMEVEPEGNEFVSLTQRLEQDIESETMRDILEFWK